MTRVATCRRCFFDVNVAHIAGIMAAKDSVHSHVSSCVTGSEAKGGMVGHVMVKDSGLPISYMVNSVFEFIYFMCIANYTKLQ